MSGKRKGKRSGKVCNRDKRQEDPRLYFDGRRWYQDTGKVTRSGARLWEPISDPGEGDGESD